jgi:1-deoxy-D-xylulose-5-phosphate reductoisomerase
MRTPIHSALVWPLEVEGCGKSLSFAQMANLTFEPIDAAKFPAIPMAFEVMRRGGTSGAIFNAANEMAVQAFVTGRISFTEISEWVARRLDRVESIPLRSLADVLEADAKVREAM